jgi:hypothetical protein
MVSKTSPKLENLSQEAENKHVDPVSSNDFIGYMGPTFGIYLLEVLLMTNKHL